LIAYAVSICALLRRVAVPKYGSYATSRWFTKD
jgi:hypothetical protein